MLEIHDELSRLVDAGLPGAFVYIQDEDAAPQFYTDGVADLASGRRMQLDDHYRVGSTTKTFTAVVILQLVAEGRLALGDTLQALLPELHAPNADRLTVEHLLRMRSGLFDFEDDPSLLGSLDAHLRPYTLSHVVGLAVKQPALFEPGTRFTYCNTNFCVLEMVAERVTGNTLGEEMRRRIFEPLGLAHTSYPDEDDLTLPEPHIRGYERDGEEWRECSEVFFGRGDGALISNAPDLARFFRALLVEQRLLPPDLFPQMMRVLPDEPPATMAYGLGLIADPMPCGPVYGHSGGGFGYIHSPFLRLDRGRFAICMLNGTYGFRALSDPAYAQVRRFSPDFRARLYCG